MVTYYPDDDEAEEEVLTAEINVCWSSEINPPLRNIIWMKKAIMSLELGCITGLVRVITQEFFDGHGGWHKHPQYEHPHSVVGFAKALDWGEDVERTSFYRIN